MAGVRLSSSTNIENPDLEYFWSVELNSENRTHSWSSKDEEMEDGDEDFISHTVFLKLAVLGDGAVPNEANVVLLESMGGDGEPQKGAIINLTRGDNSMAPLDISIAGRVGATFTLIQGSGPVHISGNLYLEYPKNQDNADQSQTESEASIDEDNDLEDEDEEAEEDDEEESPEKSTGPSGKGAKAPKRKAALSAMKSKQKAKMEVENDDDDDDDDDEDEDDDEDDYEEKTVKVKKPTKTTPKDLLKNKVKAKKVEATKAGKKLRK